MTSAALSASAPSSGGSETPHFSTSTTAAPGTAAAAHQQYTENQQRLVGFIHQSRNLLGAVERLALAPAGPHRLQYPMDLSAAAAAATGNLSPPTSHAVLGAAEDDAVSGLNGPSATSTTGGWDVAAQSELGTAATRPSRLLHRHQSHHRRSPSGASSVAGGRHSAATARLFKVLDLDVPTSRTGRVLLPSDALGALLRAKLTEVRGHLQTLEARVQDPTCRILVTGDLNAGKSTFVNALLRRDVVPADQQPLTNVFTEVLDAKHNRLAPGVEQVHAFRNAAAAVAGDAPDATFGLDALEALVEEPDGEFEVLKVYCHEDDRAIPPESSSSSDSAVLVATGNARSDTPPSVLVGNDVVDVRLIDSPGLNRDVWQTMAVFAQQEEIDVIVFVVSAENHFTLSSREFLTKAGQEKAYIFVVVNKFDAIKDKARCTKVILQQIEQLSPHTFHYRDKLVHFVSAEAMLSEAAAGRYADPTADVEQFLHVERALREFTLEKRSISKLSPAKRYLDHLLGDVEVLLEYNGAKVAEQMDDLRGELSDLRPRERALEDQRAVAVRDMERAVAQAADACDALVAATFSPAKLGDRLYERALAVPWRGIRHAMAYVRDVHAAILGALDEDVDACQRAADATMRRAWTAMNDSHAAWLGAVAEAVARGGGDHHDPAVMAPLARLAIPTASVARQLPVTSVAALTPANLLFPHAPEVRLTRSSLATFFTSPRTWLHQLASPGEAWAVVVRHATAWSWSDLAPAAMLERVGSHAAVSSLALTGCSFITSSVLATRSVSSDLVSLGLRVGLRRMAVAAVAGMAVVGSAAGYHYMATLPSHLPATLARAAVDRATAARYPETVAAHLRTTARVALTHALADAGAKMDAGLARVKVRHEELTARLAQLEEVNEALGEVRDRAELLRAQVAAVAVEDRVASAAVSDGELDDESAVASSSARPARPVRSNRTTIV
ncbi:mitofusin [Blastocladiella emersonii ATCC 22665]|nr:mitofusin [Blastocladiella emersonii ATCC 22665]